MKPIGSRYPQFQGVAIDTQALVRALETLRTRVTNAIDIIIVGRTFSNSTAWDTAKTWTDGKVIWAKYVNFGALPNTTSKNVAHSIGSISAVVGVFGMAVSSGTYHPIPNDGTLLRVDGTNVTVTTDSDLSAYSGWIVVEYTI